MILPQIDDVQCRMQIYSQLKIWHQWVNNYTVCPVGYGVYLQQSTILLNSTPKWARHNLESISQEAIYHGILTRAPHYTKALRSCSGKKMMMLLKSYLGIKCHSQYIKVIRLLQHSSEGVLLQMNILLFKLKIVPCWYIFISYKNTSLQLN